MKVYKIRYFRPDTGCQLKWVRSWRQAQSFLRQIVAECGDSQDAELFSVALVEIPTDKAGLISWLNRWVGADSG